MSKTRSIVYGNLASLIDGGLPLSRCLSVAGEHIRGRFGRSIREFGQGVHRGKSLTEMTQQRPLIYPELDRVAIEAGEMSGTLGECMKELSKWYAFVYKTRSKIIAGMALPFLLFHMMVLIVPAPAALLGKITFAEYGAIVIARVIKMYIIAALIVLAIRFRERIEPPLLLIPYFWKMIKLVATYRYCQVFHLLYKGGVPIARCAEIAASMSGSGHFKRLVKGGTENAKRGLPVFEGFSSLLDSEFVNAWSVGEESGGLEQMLEKMVDKYHFRLELMFEAIAVWVPRIVYLIVSIMLIMAIAGMAGGI